MYVLCFVVNSQAQQQWRRPQIVLKHDGDQTCHGPRLLFAAFVMRNGALFNPPWPLYAEREVSKRRATAICGMPDWECYVRPRALSVLRRCLGAPGRQWRQRGRGRIRSTRRSCSSAIAYNAAERVPDKPTSLPFARHYRSRRCNYSIYSYGAVVSTARDGELMARTVSSSHG